MQVTASKTSGTVTIVGSYGYMPLEQFLGQTTPASDLYSLGMLLLYLVTGMHPAELPEMDGCVQWQRIAKAAGLGDRFTHWLSQLSAPYADQRFKSAEVALTVLNAKDGKNGYFPHLKPDRHHIHIHRQPNELKLIAKMPISRVNPVIFPLGCQLFVILPYGLMIMIVMLGGASVVAIACLLLALTAVYIFCNKDIRQYAFVSVHRTQGVSTGIAKGKTIHSLHSFNKKQRALPLKSINFVSYSPTHTFNHFYDHKKKTKGRCHIALPAKLSVHTTGDKYTLFCADLSVAEQAWISQELKDFLGLSLQTIAQENTACPPMSQSHNHEQQQIEQGT